MEGGGGPSVGLLVNQDTMGSGFMVDQEPQTACLCNFEGKETLFHTVASSLQSVQF